MSKDTTRVSERTTRLREEFGARFRECLKRAGLEKITNEALLLEVNSRLTKEPVTVHAVRKWKVGEAIPGDANLTILATWLNVAPEWLRFGNVPTCSQPVSITQIDHSILRELSTLRDENKELVRQLVSQLLAHRLKLRDSPSYRRDASGTPMGS